MKKKLFSLVLVLCFVFVSCNNPPVTDAISSLDTSSEEIFSSETSEETSFEEVSSEEPVSSEDISSEDTSSEVVSSIETETDDGHKHDFSKTIMYSPDKKVWTNNYVCECYYQYEEPCTDTFDISCVDPRIEIAISHTGTILYKYDDCYILDNRQTAEFLPITIDDSTGDLNSFFLDEKGKEVEVYVPNRKDYNQSTFATISTDNTVKVVVK